MRLLRKDFNNILIYLSIKKHYLILQIAIFYLKSGDLFIFFTYFYLIISNNNIKLDKLLNST